MLKKRRVFPEIIIGRTPLLEVSQQNLSQFVYRGKNKYNHL